LFSFVTTRITDNPCIQYWYNWQRNTHIKLITTEDSVNVTLNISEQKNRTTRSNSLMGFWWAVLTDWFLFFTKICCGVRLNIFTIIAWTHVALRKEMFIVMVSFCRRLQWELRRIVCVRIWAQKVCITFLKKREYEKPTDQSWRFLLGCFSVLILQPIDCNGAGFALSVTYFITLSFESRMSKNIEWAAKTSWTACFDGGFIATTRKIKMWGRGEGRSFFTWTWVRFAAILQ